MYTVFGRGRPTHEMGGVPLGSHTSHSCVCYVETHVISHFHAYKYFSPVSVPRDACFFDEQQAALSALYLGAHLLFAVSRLAVDATAAAL